MFQGIFGQAELEFIYTYIIMFYLMKLYDICKIFL